MWGEKKPNFVTLECFDCRWEGGEVGRIRKVGGWWGWQCGKGERVVSLRRCGKGGGWEGWGG